MEEKNSQRWAGSRSLTGSSSVNYLTKEDGVHKQLVGTKPEGAEVGIVSKANNSTSALSSYANHCALLHTRKIARV